MNKLTRCNKMMSLIQGFVTSEVLIIAAKIDLYSHLTSSKYTVNKLAEKLKTSPVPSPVPGLAKST